MHWIQVTRPEPVRRVAQVKVTQSLLAVLAWLTDCKGWAGIVLLA